MLSTHEILAGKQREESRAAALRSLGATAALVQDELMERAVAPFASKQGSEHYAKVPTLAQLTTRFADVATASRTAALVPPGSGLWGQALAFVANSLTLTSAEVGQTPASQVISRAEAELQAGSLVRAVEAVRTLRGHPAAAAKGWLRVAEERLLLQQALSVANAEAAIASAALN